ncbi:DoxX family protein [Pedobacter mucosus]|uniref:DoxX family protein n=1 Tax=Pedobacter mucosus TaxID=2895286 RepID=UPI001EE4D65C|nr:DoxX family protein [Pedobacter mucosus]UKT63759.1 DoxX family protein [Pedobacter mucosus]
MDTKLAYLLSRLAIGLSFFGHGLIRLPKLTGFSNWMMGQFSKSFLPDILVLSFSYVLPFAEFIAGILIIFGLFTRTGLVLGGVITLALIFGSTMIENWDALPSQLIHIAFLSILLAYLPHNNFAVDKILKNKQWNTEK